MANTSTKNFPHAYGAGRCVAAFSLSHPGGPPVQGQEAQNVLMQPPALSMIADGVPPPAYPDRSISFTPDDPAVPAGPGTYRVGYSADRQPYNATSFGVYCTGSGTRALPYRDAIAPFVPASVSPSLHAVLPGTTAADNLVRPFGVVDDTRLGTTRAQYVAQAETDGAGDVESGPACWYEVGMNWKVPPITMQLAASGSFSTNWPSTQIANVRDSIMKTLWIQASVADNATAEPHPEWVNSQPFGLLSADSAMQLNPPLNTNPAPGTGWEAPYGYGLTYAQDPGPMSFSSGVIEPDTAPTAAGADVIEAGPVYSPRADLVLKCYRVEQTTTAADPTGAPSVASTITTVMHVAPVVRVWVLQNTAGGDWAPAPLGRGFTRPCSSDSALQPPCINVQV
ncbi:MAG: hypothetical protein GY842_10995, partial [bacterium]|nr:hypothetical protein [bacterium]